MMAVRVSILVASILNLMASSGAQAIVGGRDVQAGEAARGFTLQVAAGRGQLCSGTAIESDLVLTAAHCLSQGGRIAVTSVGSDGRARRHPVAGFAVHPSFVSGLTPHRQPGTDLALVRLAAPLPADMTSMSSGSSPWTGETLAIAGFGLGEERRSGSARRLRQADLVAIGPYTSTNTVAIAADPAGLGSTAGAGACRGDSGGPVFRPGGALVGIVSWSSGPLKQERRRVCGGITSFTPVADHQGWIAEAAGRLRRGETQVAPARYSSGQGR
jgi:secreted trypsin-like serine protease